jgi:ankyrin repeat protein
VLTPHAFYYVSTQGNETPLFLASQFGHPDIVKLLTDEGADINIVVINLNYTPLLVATAGGHADVIRYLIESGASIHAVDVVRALRHLLRQYLLTLPVLIFLLG